MAATDLAAPAESQSETRAGLRSGAFAVPARLKWSIGLVLPIALAIGWEAAVRLGLASGRLMPPPSRVAETLYELAKTGELWGHLWATVWRVLAGFAFGGSAGIVLGAVSGASATARRLLDPTPPA